MDVIKITGGIPLKGEISISGAKNAALPIFAATLLTEEPCILKNVPDLSDIQFMKEILQHLGASVEKIDESTWRLEAKNIKSKAPYDLVRKMRASICVLGPLAGRIGKAEISLPGGCVIGQRPIDLHLKGLKHLNCDITVEKGYIHVDASKAKGSYIFLGGRHGSTVLGTANILMAATLIPGITTIENAACEPEIVDLCNMLVKMGAKIRNIGSHTLIIEGVESLHGCTHSIIPDRIEAGTYMLAAAITKGHVIIHGARQEHLGALLDKLEKCGQPVKIIDSETIEITPPKEPLQSTEIITHPYPGFPTDLQAQMVTFLTLIPGLSITTERIYPSRFMHVPELQRMGADISTESSSIIINGVKKLSGAPIMASDLRASVSLILAGLAAEGETWVQRIYHVDRGYEKIDIKLSQLGAKIERLPADQIPHELIY